MEPFRAEMEKAERERLKVEENYFASQALTNELDTLLTEGNQIIQQQKEVTGLANIREPRINKTISDITARTGVIQAVLSARSGQIAQAYNLIDRSVQATTADRQDQLNYYNTLLQFYTGEKDSEGNNLVNLTNEQKQYIQANISLLQNDLAMSMESVENIKSAMANPATAKIYADAGISLNDSIAEINSKLSQYTYQQEIIGINNQAEGQGLEFILPEQVSQYDQARVQSFTDSKGKVYNYLKPAPEEDLVSLQGGLYDKTTGTWKVAPKDTGGGGGGAAGTYYNTETNEPVSDYEAAQAELMQIQEGNPNMGAEALEVRMREALDIATSRGDYKLNQTEKKNLIENTVGQMEFISTEWLRENIDMEDEGFMEMIKEFAPKKREDFSKFWMGSGEEEKFYNQYLDQQKDAYILQLMKQAQEYRKAGLTDQQILTKLSE